MCVKENMSENATEFLVESAGNIKSYISQQVNVTYIKYFLQDFLARIGKPLIFCVIIKDMYILAVTTINSNKTTTIHYLW